MAAGDAVAAGEVNDDTELLFGKLKRLKWPQRQWIFPLKMVIFHGYLKLPEGINDDSGIQNLNTDLPLFVVRNLAKRGEHISLATGHRSRDLNETTRTS